MQIKGIYIFLLLGFIQLAAIYVASPYMASQNIAEIVQSEDETAWTEKADRDYLKKYSRTLLDGLLQAQMMRDQKTIGLREAMLNYQFARKTALAKEVDLLTSAKGLPRLMCAEIINPPANQDNPADCWAMNGRVKWLGPNKVALEYENPGKHWRSRLFLQRDGLLSWRVVDIELPVEQMLNQFAA